MPYETLLSFSAACPVCEPVRGSLASRCELYAFGGQLGEDRAAAERLPVGGERWEVLPRMKQNRTGAAAAAVAGRIYVCGGCAETYDTVWGRTLRSAERYDPVLGAWQALPDLAERRRSATGSAVGGRIYVCGGEGGCDGEVLLNSAERFDPELWRWEAIPPLKGHRYGAAAAAARGLVCVLGGCLGVDALSSVERFCPTAWRWKDLPEMLHARVGAAAAAAPDGTILVCGGVEAEAPDCVERLRPGVERWEEVASATVQHFRFAAYASAGGHLYVFGGQYQKRSGLAAVRRIDCHRGASQELPSLAEGRLMAVGARLLR